MRLAIAGECDEGDVFAAGALDVAAADDALRLGEQDDFQVHGWRISRRPRHVVAKTLIKTGKV